eukprot:gb/GECG01007402.1/.p1 GENE.gb/GECG01007402.1/~~gb/GECG01007402.1/.p1  ORF type:complete len:508 (+),score=60.96 gb/GECG01007402.1/:1-1524(+)
MSSSRVDIRVGGVSEHFNRPIHRAKESGLFRDNDVQVQWYPCSGGTGQMMKDLRNGDIDVAFALTEGIVNHALQGMSDKSSPEEDEITIISPYIATPLTWGVIVGYDQPYERLRDLQGLPIAVSRMGSGSHLMSVVLAEREHWDKQKLDFTTQNDFRTLRKSVNTPVHAGGAGFFLWEYFTTKPFVDAREVRFIDSIQTPWPCFMVAARKNWAKENRDLINRFLATLRQSSKEFVLDPVSAIQEIRTHYGLTTEDARSWLKSVAFAQEGAVEEDSIVTAIRVLHQVGVLSDQQLLNACGRTEQTMSNVDKWQVYSQAAYRVINTSLVRILPPLGENAVFGGGHESTSHRSGVQTVDIEFGSVGGNVNKGDEPSADASDSSQEDKQAGESSPRKLLASGHKMRTRSRISVVSGPEGEAREPGEAAAAGMGLSMRNLSNFRIDAGHMAFASPKEYEAWQERKKKALQLVEGHIFAYGGVPTAATTVRASEKHDRARTSSSGHEDPLPSY